MDTKAFSYRGQKNKLIALVFLILLSGLWSCSSGGNKKNSENVAEGEYSGTLRVGHVVGICMSPLFLAHHLGYFEEEGLSVELVWMQNPGDGMNLLNSGELQLTHHPFTNTLRAVDQGADLKIVAGSGMHGLVSLAQPELGISTVKDLLPLRRMGIKAGNQRLNSLELTFYGLIRDQGMTYDDFDMKYFFDHFSMQSAFVNKEIDICTHVEPYATLLSDNHGAVRIGSSVDTWGEGSPDCVVTVQSEFIEKYPETLRKYTRAILRADRYVKANMQQAVVYLNEGKYYRVDSLTLASALPRQPPGVDLRKGLPGLEKAIRHMVELGYMKKAPENLVDLTILEEVLLEENISNQP